MKWSVSVVANTMAPMGVILQELVLGPDVAAQIRLAKQEAPVIRFSIQQENIDSKEA